MAHAARVSRNLSDTVILKRMKIAIVGYGVEGRASYNYFSRSPENEIVVFDEFSKRPADLPNDVLFVTGAHALEELKSQRFDKVLRTPPLAPHKLAEVSNVTSGTREFFRQCPAPIIGVTGSKGKGTIASLIYEIFKAAGKSVWLVGNIGKPALDVLPEVKPGDIVVYELSSFQLWDLEQSPHTAVISMVEPEHLDVHANVDEYYQAKGNIRRFQTIEDYCFYHPTNAVSKQIADMGGPQDPSDRELWRTKSSRYAIPDDGAVYVKSNTFFVHNQQICGIDALQLVGQHNLENACAAISAALVYTHDYTAVEKGLKAFKGLPHRLQFVGEKSGVKYYDDSIATTPGSAIAALKAFDEPKILIVGGSDKGADFAPLAREVLTRNTRQVIAIGAMGPVIADELRKAGYANITETEELMPGVVGLASKAAQPGDTVILSPSCASFDQYKNYADRGEQFTAAVAKL